MMKNNLSLSNIKIQTMNSVEFEIYRLKLIRIISEIDDEEILKAVSKYIDKEVLGIHEPDPEDDPDE